MTVDVDDEGLLPDLMYRPETWVTLVPGHG
jgi:hypothetical protein